MSAPTRAELDRRLAALQARLADRPEDLDLAVERADLLATLGRTAEAQAAYLAVLQHAPDHYGALINFGSMLHETGFRTAARTLFARAVEIHPQEPMSHVNLANVLMYGGEPAAARGHYETALRLDPANVEAHQRLSELLRQAGELEAAQRHRRLGFGARPARSFPCLGAGEPVPLLVLCSTPAGDVAWRKLVDEQVFATTALTAEFHDPAAPLPPHALVFNAIGDADVSAADLAAAEAILARTTAPVLNAPARVRTTGRAENARRLAGLPGVHAPLVRTYPRTTLSAETLAADGLRFPLLLRSPGFHTGLHFVRVETPADLAAAAAALPGCELTAIEHLDGRGPDGLYRKYRVMMIDGQLYPLHMAASRHWKVHYFSAEMSGEPARQAEEALFLADMAGALGAPAMQSLEAIRDALGLNYGGVDFGLGAAGELLLYEANAVMNIVPPDPSPQWDYRRPACDAALAAARGMLVRRARMAADGCRPGARDAMVGS